MNKINRKEKLNEEKTYVLSPNEKVTYVFQSEAKFDVTFRLKEKAIVEVFHYGKNTSGKIKIYLEGEDAELIYHYNAINWEENQVKVEVFHQAKKTKSALYFHGLNQENQALTFLVDVTIPKGMAKSKAIQENRIYNVKNGTALITPNLYIDEFDVDAEHASFIGPFQEEIEFYLASRGLSVEQRETLLLEGLLIQEGLTEEEKFDFFQTRKEG